MKPVVIFGVGELAQLADFYLSKDAGRDVAAFTVDAQYRSSDTVSSRPLVAFETLATHFPPDRYDMFVAVGYSNLNRTRADKCRAAKSMGYQLVSYVSSRAMVWQDLRIGENCMIMEGNVIQPFVRIGDNVIMFGSSLVSHHVDIGDNCFIASEVTISGGVHIGENSFLGVNSTIREHRRIGRNCIIGAGALILRDTADESSYLVSETKASGIPSRMVQSLL
jgi:sugar O-acyltransferase (sialic acid O-acetyltransferase NeuD family)